MNTNPLVSVIIPCFNAARYLKDCISSVLAQTYQNTEIIVVDDGSTDESMVIAQELALAHERIEVLRNPNGENKGVSFTRQFGIDQAKGSFIAFLDADDLYEPEKIEIQLSRLEQASDCVLSHTGVSVIASDANDVVLFENHFGSCGDTELEYLLRNRNDYLKNNNICNSSVLVRAEPLKKLNISHPQLFQYEDWTLWVRLSPCGKFLYLPHRLARYRVHEAAATEKVRTSDLIRNYSHIEFLLSVAALSDNSKLRRDVVNSLTPVMAELMSIYAGLDRRVGASTLSALNTRSARLEIQLQAKMNALGFRLGRVVTWPLRYVRNRAL